jgi:antitoxin ParD1/3/4
LEYAFNGTASEYIRSLIRSDQKRQATLRLEALFLEGLDSETATPMTERDWASIRAKVQEKV